MYAAPEGGEGVGRERGIPFAWFLIRGDANDGGPPKDVVSFNWNEVVPVVEEAEELAELVGRVGSIVVQEDVVVSVVSVEPKGRSRRRAVCGWEVLLDPRGFTGAGGAGKEEDGQSSSIGRGLSGDVPEGVEAFVILDIDAWSIDCNFSHSLAFKDTVSCC